MTYQEFVSAVLDQCYDHWMHIDQIAVFDILGDGSV